MAGERTMARGGFDVSIFVETPQLLFDCPLCHRVLRRPHLTACGRNVCESCLDENRSSCPLCNGAVCDGANYGKSAVLNRHIWNEISQLKVRCSCKPVGCNWVGNVEQFVDKHNGECGYVELECDYGCGLKVPRRQNDFHLLECERYPISCPRECGAAFERRLCETHLSRDCPLQEVACLFEEEGCTVKTERVLHKAHLDAELDTHIGLVAKKSLEAREKWCKERDTRIAKQEAKLKAREEERAALSETLRGLEDKAQSLQKFVTATEKELYNLQQEQIESAAIAQQETRAQDDEVKMAKKGVLYLQKRTREKVMGPPLPRYAQYLSRPFPAMTEMYVPPLVLTIINFSQQRKDDECWYSHPFYSHRKGYKLCLEVYPNGLNGGRGTFVSIFITLMKGEFDEDLSWPISRDFRVTLLCQNNAAGNVTKEMSFRGTDDSTRRVYDGYFAENSPGYARFITQTALYPTAIFPQFRYLMHDCVKIYVEITDDK